MSLLIAIAILLSELYLIALIIIGLHRLSPRWGLPPLLIFIGMLTAALQLRVFGFFELETGANLIRLAQGSFLILPNLLLGLLIIYIINGTHQARFSLVGIVLIGLVAGAIQLIPAFQIDQPGFTLLSRPVPTVSPAYVLLSTILLSLDVLVLIIVYQWVSNLRKNTLSRTAIGLALLAGVITDSLTFPLLAYPGSPYFSTELTLHLVGQGLAVAVLWPLLLVYLPRTAANQPDLAAAYPRQALDIISATLRLEAQADRQFNLLHTLIQIDQLILRSDNPQELLDQACQQIVAQGANWLAWIGLVDLDVTQVRIHARAGAPEGYPEPVSELASDRSVNPAPHWQSIEQAEAVVVADIPSKPKPNAWQNRALENGFHSVAALPLRHGGYVLGTLNVYAPLVNAFPAEQVRVLQQLADDLAYALVSLEARRQQLTLHTAAENMQDGLIITNINGQIVYANQATAELVGRSTEDLEGASFIELMFSPTQPDQIEHQFQALRHYGRVAFDYEFNPPGQAARHYAIRASMLHDTTSDTFYMVINLRDRTERHKYERQLEALNRFVTDMVDAHSLQSLVRIVFAAGGSLLQADTSALYLLATDGKTIGEQYLHNLSQDQAELAVGNPDLPIDTVLCTGQPVLVSDTRYDEQYGERLNFLNIAGMNALMALPVLYHREPIGALVFYYPRPRAFFPRDLQLAHTLARTLAITIQNLRLYQAEHNQRQFSEALAEAGSVLNRSLNLDEVLDQIMRQTLRVIGCRAVNVMLIENQMARVVRALDITKPDETHPLKPRYLPLSTPTLEAMLATRVPVIIPNTLEDDRWYRDAPSAWILSYAAAPLTLQEEVIGFLNMNSDQVNFFSPGVAERVQAFAAAAATAIQNARLYRDLEEHSQDLEERVRARTSELSHAKEQIERILVAVPDAVFVLDDQQRLEQANPAGDALLSLAHQEGIELFATDFMQALGQGRLPTEKAVLEVKERFYQAAVSMLSLQDNQLGSVVVFRDVTRFRELDQMKTRFVSDVSHELRTPLTNLSLYLDLMTMVKDPARHREYLATLRRETERLTHLIEDLLTISRLEAGRVEIIIEPVDIPELVNHLVNDRIPMAAQRELTLTCSTAPNLPAAWADYRLLSQVLSNLLTNALNYTVSGGLIHLHSDLKQGEHECWVSISVKDNGVGIAPDELEHLFVRFYRGTASETTGAEGTGLGLAISREMVERMEGRISVESEPGYGSTFTVWLKAIL